MDLVTKTREVGWFPTAKMESSHDDLEAIGETMMGIDEIMLFEIITNLGKHR